MATTLPPSSSSPSSPPPEREVRGVDIAVGVVLLPLGGLLTLSCALGAGLVRLHGESR